MLIDLTAGHGLLSFYGCIFWLQPYSHASGQSRENRLHHRSRVVLLQIHAVRIKECRHDVPEANEQNVMRTDWKKHGGLCRRHPC
jgi:hypothetical protein